MQIVVHSSSPGKRALVEASARFYEQELRLQKSKYVLEIQFKKGLAKREGMRGCVSDIAPRHLIMLLDSGLKDHALFETLAHEMIHVKQYARGQFRIDRNKTIWLGKPLRLKYYQQPWEIEAFGKEKVLASKIYNIIWG